MHCGRGVDALLILQVVAEGAESLEQKAAKARQTKAGTAGKAAVFGQVYCSHVAAQKSGKTRLATCCQMTSGCT
jgi:hypothetical protein